MIITHPVFRRGIFLSTLLLAHSGLALEYFFTPPEAPFLIAPNEQVTTLELASGTAESAQSRIDSLRTTHANAVQVIRLSGKLLIDKHPLQLAGRTCLILEAGAGLAATADATAESLLQIEGAECFGFLCWYRTRCLGWARSPPGGNPRQRRGQGKLGSTGDSRLWI